jgi:hypothetical protein
MRRKEKIQLKLAKRVGRKILRMWRDAKSRLRFTFPTASNVRPKDRKEFRRRRAFAPPPPICY